MRFSLVHDVVTAVLQCSKADSFDSSYVEACSQSGVCMYICTISGAICMYALCMYMQRVATLMEQSGWQAKYLRSRAYWCANGVVTR
jgi:hypothetical protein